MVPARDAGPAGRVLRLDGAVATELRAAGIPIGPPWWTTAALLTARGRAALRAVHRRHLAAGAQVVTANTFRCNARALRASGVDATGRERLVRLAVAVARAAGRAAADGAPIVAGSMAPVEDCYRPDLVPDGARLRAEHGWLARSLVRCGVDVVLIETMNTAREARVALERVLAAGGRAWVSFVCVDGARLLSGERLAPVAAAVLADGAEAVLVNCTTPADTETCLRALRAAVTGRIGGYPNLEDRRRVARWTHVDQVFPEALPPDRFGALAARWCDEFGATLLGGCCGASPRHIAALRDAVTRAGR